MNNYRIQHEVNTLSQLNFFNPNGTIINIDGFFIENWGLSTQIRPFGDKWIVSKTINAEKWTDAINSFRKKFQKIASQLSFVSQCYLDFLGGSYVIEKLNNNAERIFILKHIIPADPVGLTLGKEEYESYLQIQQTPLNSNSSFFTYMQEANNTYGYFGRLSLLCGALEALAGIEERTNDEGGKFTTYNRENMLRILGESFNDIFGKEGLRHKIQHGDSIESYLNQDYITLIYQKILSFINTTHSLNLDREIINPQRHFYGNESFSTRVLKPINDSKIDIGYFFQNSRIVTNYQDCSEEFSSETY